MSQLTFAQSERRSYLGPILVAVAVLTASAAAAYIYLPHRVADVTVTHIAVVPVQTVFQTGSKLVGHQQYIENDLYVLTTLGIDDPLHDPLFLNDIQCTFTSAQDAVITASASSRSDLDAIYLAFPQVKSFSSVPLLSDSTIQPGNHAEGMVLFHLPLTQDEWNNRKSASLTVTFYHQAPVTLPIPGSARATHTP